MTVSSGANTGDVRPTTGPIDIADRPSRTFWPIGHRKPGDQPANHLTALEQQLLRRDVQRLEWNLEIARYELP